MLFSGIRRIAGLAAAATAALTLTAAAPAMADPAIWVVKDADSTIYLFGTVHLLKDGVQWKTAKVEKALESADSLWLETDTSPEGAQKLQPIVMQYGVDTAKPLSGKITAQDQERLKATETALGMPAGAFEPMKPWLAGLVVSVAPLQKAGYDPKLGVEETLKAQIAASGKPVKFLESGEQQIRFFADLPEATQVTFLRSALDDMDDGPAKLDEMVGYWSKGDVAGLEKAMVEEMKTKYPELYKALLVDRNADWANQIKTQLDGKGVSFIAVGAAHLAGPDSVQALLQKKGVKVERY